MLQVKQKRTLHGDTIIEVMMSLAIFSIIAIMTVSIMNSGVNNAQRTLEYTMARNEMDAQAEALRYLHQSYVSERQYSTAGSNFTSVWNSIKNRALAPNVIGSTGFDVNNEDNDCHTIYQNISAYRPFVVNSRAVLPDTGSYYSDGVYASSASDVLWTTFGTNQEASIYPRIIYQANGSVSRASGGKTSGNSSGGALVEKRVFNAIQNPQGIYIVAVGENGSNLSKSKYYDFYIHTCWHSVGAKTASTITTIVRLYNPEGSD